MKCVLQSIENKAVYALLTFSVAGGGDLKRLNNYIGRPVTLSVDELNHGRTLTQNAYLWVLVGKIAEALNASKDEIYLKFLKAYGQSVMVSVALDEALKFERKAKYFEKESTDEERTVYRFIAGSSEYDTLEMKILLDGVIEEAEALGIPTLTPGEIERMKLK